MNLEPRRGRKARGHHGRDREQRIERTTGHRGDRANENDIGPLGPNNHIGTKGVVILAKKDSQRDKPKDEPQVVRVEKREDRKLDDGVLRNNRASPISGPTLQKPQLNVSTLQAKSSLAAKAVSEAVRSGGIDGAGRNEMAQRAKFLNKHGELEEDLLRYLTDDASFKVVGVIGPQGAGKSHVLNILAGRAAFPVERADDTASCRPRTVGIDAFVTPDRIVLLDVQPVLSLSSMDALIQSEKRTPSGAIDYHQSLESQVMVESLQTACFLLSVCHVVIVCFDWFFDRDLAQFLQSAEMLKPTTPRTATTNVLDDEISDYFPHVVFVKNKCDLVSYKDNKVMTAQLSRVFKDSMLMMRDGVTNSFGKPVSDEAVNVFQMPLKTDPMYETCSRELLSKVLSMPYDDFVELKPGTFTERNWFQYATKIWEGIRKSGMFQEYKRLLV